MKVRKRDRPKEAAAPGSRMRCAVYTRKSSDEGLDQEFNSLDAQRESAEAFISSQKTEGWVCLPDRYDDGGFSGGSIERPALGHLLRDIEAGKIDCVVVYKVDRLSRSLMDFAKIMEAFDRKGVSFVSVTQQFNTTSSMGRLTLNILLSFAQFEREIIGERIRDKIAAQKRKGKWAGGVPVLGYDVDRSGPSPRLVVNAREAVRVRALFDLYLEKQSLLPVVRELRHREWTNKKRVTKKTGKVIGGKPFNKATLHNHLVNPVYIGKITHKGEIYDGVHEAIVDPEIFERVQKLLRYNGRTGGFEVRNKYGALLRGLITCKACGYAMTHTFTKDKKGGPRFYRYYRCTHAIKNGASECPSRTLPAAEIERVVVDEIRGLGSDRALLKQVLADAHATIAEEREGLVTERADLKRTMDRCHRELQTLAAGGLADTDVSQRIAELHEQITAGDKRLPEVEKRIGELDAETITQAQAEAAFRDFDPVWENLIPREQARLIRLLVSAVEYDAVKSSVSVTFRPTSIRAFLDRIKKEAA